MSEIAYIQVNRYCNNRCHFCSNPSNGRSMEYDEGMAMIDAYRDRWCSEIVFTGGEPTLSECLPKWIAHTHIRGMSCRIVTNGSMCADTDYVDRLVAAGLRTIHISLYSHLREVHDFLTDTPGSWRRVVMGLQHTTRAGMDVQINTVINRYNQWHLDAIVRFVLGYFPSIRHFVWNNIEPSMMRRTETALSTLADFEIFPESLGRAMETLVRVDKTFRVEEVPLCFMRGYEYAATETRKIVKGESRLVYYLDGRSLSEQSGDEWHYGTVHVQPVECGDCDLHPLCAGVRDYDGIYSYVRVRSQRVGADVIEAIRTRIHTSDR